MQQNQIRFDYLQLLDQDLVRVTLNIDLLSQVGEMNFIVGVILADVLEKEYFGIKQACSHTFTSYGLAHNDSIDDLRLWVIFAVNDFDFNILIDIHAIV